MKSSIDVQLFIFLYLVTYQRQKWDILEVKGLNVPLLKGVKLSSCFLSLVVPKQVLAMCYSFESFRSVYRTTGSFKEALKEVTNKSSASLSS